MKKKISILIMAGGTGGHVFPALALALRCQAQDIEVYWLGTSKGLEATKIPALNIPFYVIPMQGVRGKSWRNWIALPWRFLFSVFFCCHLIKKHKIDFVFGFGGFVTAPGGFSAFLARKPLYLHEQNSVMGSANRFLSRFAKIIFTGFPNIQFVNSKIKYIGNPIRENLLHFENPALRFSKKSQKNPFRILVLGGSLGAKIINECIPKMLALFSQDLRLEIWHQTGNQHFSLCQAQYEKMDLAKAVRLMPFIEDMQTAYLWADIVICRSGALTLAELAAVGLPSILIPFPFAIDNHQYQNAKFFADAGAAILQDEKALSPTQLAEHVKTLMEDHHLRVTMASAAFELRQVRAVEEMISVIGGR